MENSKPTPPGNVIFANALTVTVGPDEVLLDFKRTSPESPDATKAEVLVRVIGTTKFLEVISTLLTNSAKRLQEERKKTKSQP